MTSYNLTGTAQYMTVEQVEDFLDGLPYTGVDRLPYPWVGNKLECEGVTIYLEHTTVRGLPRILVSLEVGDEHPTSIPSNALL